MEETALKVHTHSLLYKGSPLELAETEILVLKRPGLEGGGALGRAPPRSPNEPLVEKGTLT